MENILMSIWCFYFSRIDMVRDIFCINMIKYPKEGLLFRYTSNHTADWSESCLKTVDVFICSSIIFPYAAFWLRLFLLLFSLYRAETLQQLVTLHVLFWFPLLYSLTFVSNFNVRCWKLYFITGFGCETGMRKKDECIRWKWGFLIETSVQFHPYQTYLVFRLSWAVGKKM